MKLKTNLADRRNYGAKRSTSKIKYIVIHYTANDGDTDEGNGNYFKNNVVKTSAHYFVDDDSVTQSVPDDYVAWHCGGGLQGSRGHSYYQICNNTNSIGIEICDDVKNGTIYPSEKTIANVIELTTYLMHKYAIPRKYVIRHHDVTGKICPAYWCGTIAKDMMWKSEFWNKLPSDGSTSVVTPNPTQGGSTVTVTLNVLKNGSKGENVKALQILLNGRGFNCGTADGILGSKTVTAIKSFQDKNGLTKDGVVGAATWKALLK